MDDNIGNHAAMVGSFETSELVAGWNSKAPPRECQLELRGVSSAQALAQAAVRPG